MGIESVFPKTVFSVLGLPIRNTVLHTWVIMAALLGFGLWTRGRYRVWRPRGWQITIEYIVDYVERLILDTGGRALPELVPYLTTMLVFIGTANLLGLLPTLLAPTRDLNTAIALSLFSLLSVQYFGISRRGLGRYLRSFVEPVFIMLPLNIIGMFSRALSMALRLFGNIIAGEMISGVMFMLVPVLAPLPLVILGMITGVLQALVFTILTFVFVVEAMGFEAPEDSTGQRETLDQDG